MKCELVDVFADRVLRGNGLTIFSECEHLSSEQMLTWTQEMKQFESIFVFEEDTGFRARIFTVEEELDFAGHPLIGLALHLAQRSNFEVMQWQVALNRRSVTLSASMENGNFKASMRQGAPSFSKTLSPAEAAELYRALNLEEHQPEDYPAEVISTGLPYVILPIHTGLDQVRYTCGDISALLEQHGAKFLYVLDIAALEGRTWDNAGSVEDVATGSAAGPTAAYLHKHQLITDEQVSIAQGRFANRPSAIEVALHLAGGEIYDISVSGQVVKVADLSFCT